MKSIGPVIEKTEAFIISEIFHKSDRSLVYIGKDDREIINIKNKLTWLLPDQLVLQYKAWDQIPYDNISPSKKIQTSRLETLFHLSLNSDNKIIILTTVNAVIQKTLPKIEITKYIIEDFIKIFTIEAIIMPIRPIIKKEPNFVKSLLVV